MTKLRKTSIFMVIFVILDVCGSVQGKYSGGTGTELDPYLISTPEDMNAIGGDPCDWDKHFLMTADIDLSQYTNSQFNVIVPDWRNPFNGVFDGDGHIISNFTYDGTSMPFWGMFGVLGDQGRIENLGVEDVNINTTGGAGTLAGDNSGVISNCYVTGNISGSGETGGLVGGNGGSILDCYVSGNVSGTYRIGGLAGKNNGTISNCYATGNVSGSSVVGGIVGWNFGPISNCHTSGSVQGTDEIGGLIGNCGYSTTVTGCYATGQVQGTGHVGGLIGDCGSSTTVTECYATGLLPVQKVKSAG
jgi:hypothetical protein